ncbi:hypothetical protein LOTGIDRAFT_156712 [Lottia gigantea]|uniref:SMB domain-containing protein n=1 Tax=Lottia gigantea TaxID=225164 RepID=V4BA57_LOTGI|nr:hypothetical protein LOTGIDRAFT_156712 [Lottia gigantea]ESP02767.1 hypothetical protein LOTGIDRAFT_156712 [Lottia gigantea]
MECTPKPFIHSPAMLLRLIILIAVIPALVPYEEDFYERVVSEHIKYCGDGRVCKKGLGIKCKFCEDCDCDEPCFEIGDCCPDKDFALRLSDPPKIGYECVSSLVESLYPSDIFNTRKDIEDKYAMIVSCPHEDSDLQFNCYNSITLPVSSTGNSTTFRNKHCAACHNITNIRPWQITLQCIDSTPNDFDSTPGLIEKVINDETCTVKFQAPEGMTERKCRLPDKNTISQCNVTGLWPQYDEFLEKACKSYLTIADDENQTYRNPLCLKCNFPKPYIPRCNGVKHIPGLTPSFTALLDFSDLLHDKDEVIKSQCPPQTIYDPGKTLDKESESKIFTGTVDHSECDTRPYPQAFGTVSL